jgi:hypothetical protein
MLAQAPESVFDGTDTTRTLRDGALARRFEGGSPPTPLLYATVPGLEMLSCRGMSNVAAQIEKASRARHRSMALDRW